ncbi:MAG: FecCD family ABC transporter permease [Candidatus Cryptobacteroides sp.]
MLKNRKTRTIIILLAAVFLACLDLFAGGGTLSIPSGTVLSRIRLPRVLTAIFCGASLSLSGLLMQGIFRNPLADPHIMGVSSGAGVGAAVATLLSGASISATLSSLTVAGASFLGAILSAVLITAAASKFRDSSTLLVFGVMLGFVFSAIVSILQYSASAERLKAYCSWSAGSFSGSRDIEIAILGICTLAGLVSSFLHSRRLDIILFGDEYAVLVGENPSSIRIAALASGCLMTGAVTAFCGPLGFVGIVAPHLARTFLGTSVHRHVIPGTVFTGAGLSLVSDIVSQVFPFPVPVGSTLAMIGIPVILYILCSSRHA